MAAESITGMTWSPLEVESIVGTYFEMLELELAGSTYVKKAFIHREIKVAGRSRGSIEFKFQNISAVLHKHGLPFIHGYKPSSNFQIILAEAVLRRLADQFDVLASACEAAVPRTAPEIVPAPGQTKGLRSSHRIPSPQHVDWMAIESARRCLGRAGEACIVDFERERLTAAGRPHLANKVRWTSEKSGDGDGYDIQSYSVDGDILYIEVKTTIGGIGTPFFLTRNEIDVSQALGDQYRLYRLFDFAKVPKLYILHGNLAASCVLAPNVYSAFPAVWSQ